MTQEPLHFVLVGLPSTGKTTFLAALWHIVNSPDASASGHLKLKLLSGDAEYLNKIHSQWAEYRKVERTKMGSESIASMELTHKSGASSATIEFPDLSGEQFQQQVGDRSCTPKYRELIRSAHGILLFIHSGDIRRPDPITQAQQLADTIRTDTTEAEDASTSISRPWDSADAPTAVKIVELLQFVAHLSPETPQHRIAIILSAWDLQSTNALPDEFLTERLPLLDQFLKANDDRFLYRVYGLSAQGGPLDTEQQRQTLAQDTDLAANRIQVKFGSEQSNDITLPIKWLLGIDTDAN